MNWIFNQMRENQSVGIALTHQHSSLNHIHKWALPLLFSLIRGSFGPRMVFPRHTSHACVTSDEPYSTDTGQILEGSAVPYLGGVDLYRVIAVAKTAVPFSICVMKHVLELPEL